MSRLKAAFLRHSAASPGRRRDSSGSERTTARTDDGAWRNAGWEHQRSSTLYLTPADNKEPGISSFLQSWRNKESFLSFHLHAVLLLLRSTPLCRLTFLLWQMLLWSPKRPTLQLQQRKRLPTSSWTCPLQRSGRCSRELFIFFNEQSLHVF